MNQEIEPAPFLADGCKYLVEGSDVFYVTWQDQIGPERLCERPHAFAEGLALIGESKRRPMRRQRAGNAPGNGVVIGDPHNHPALALHQSLHAQPRIIPGILHGSAPHIHCVAAALVDE